MALLKFPVVKATVTLVYPRFPALEGDEPQKLAA